MSLLTWPSFFYVKIMSKNMNLTVQGTKSKNDDFNKIMNLKLKETKNRNVCLKKQDILLQLWGQRDRPVNGTVPWRMRFMVTLVIMSQTPSVMDLYFNITFFLL